MSEETKQILIFASAACIIILSIASCTAIDMTVSKSARQAQYMAEKAQYENGCASVDHSHSVKVGPETP